jgi:hypothetical protein
MDQSCLDFSAPPLAQARAVGAIASQLATDKAERECQDFRARAEAAILAKLAAGPASGEDLTDYVRDCGVSFKDGRALGSVYASMQRRGLIRIVGECKRRRGHGTSGGHIWARCD